MGPFVIDKFSSPHMAVLRNPDTGLCLERPVHLNRLKMAYVREPQPTPYHIALPLVRMDSRRTDKMAYKGLTTDKRHHKMQT